MRPGDLPIVAVSDIELALRRARQGVGTGTWSLWFDGWLAGDRTARSSFGIARAMRSAGTLVQMRATLAAQEWSEAQGLEGRQRETALQLCAILVRAVLSA